MSCRAVSLTAGEIDRVALGQIAFADASARRRLNKATHVPVALELLRQLLAHWLACRWLVVRQVFTALHPSHVCLS